MVDDRLYRAGTINGTENAYRVDQGVRYIDKSPKKEVQKKHGQRSLW